MNRTVQAAVVLLLVVVVVLQTAILVRLQRMPTTQEVKALIGASAGTARIESSYLESRLKRELFLLGEKLKPTPKQKQ